MNPETKSAEALARELAERAMLKLNGGALVRRVILEETKLRELCACAEALRAVKRIADHSSSTIGIATTGQIAEQALAALDGGGK